MVAAKVALVTVALWKGVALWREVVTVELLTAENLLQYGVNKGKVRLEAELANVEVLLLLE